MLTLDNPAATRMKTTLVDDAFVPGEAVQSIPQRLLRFAAELALLGLAGLFVLSPGAINDRHRIVLALLGLSLPALGWGVYKLQFSGMGCRLWLLFGAGFTLSLAVAKTNLQRPPSMPAAACAIAVGCFGLLSLASVFLASKTLPTTSKNGRQHRITLQLTGLEASIAGATALFAIVLGLLFSVVGAQNGLDNEVLHTALGELLDYGLLILGISVVSGHRDSFLRMSLIVGLACLVRFALRHAAAG